MNNRYAKVIDASKRVRFDIEQDVIRGRTFDLQKKYLPDGLSLAGRFATLSSDERRFISQIQGRTYANMFGLVERFIGAKVLEVSREHWLGDQQALEALVRFTDEELKHQEMFRRLDGMMGEVMPAGYRFVPRPNDIAAFVLGKSTWAVLALVCHIELFVMAHYRSSIRPDAELSGLWKDVFMFHWREESQHAIIDELEWRREHAKLAAQAVDAGVSDLIELVAGVDGVLGLQAAADAVYFVEACGRAVGAEEAARIRAALLAAYRWQYIVSGVQEPRFGAILASLTTTAQRERIGSALAPILADVGAIEQRLAA